MLTAEQIAAIAAKALEDKKANDVKVLRTTEHTVLADYFVICNGSSSTHIKALVDEFSPMRPDASTIWSACGAMQRWWMSHPFRAPDYRGRRTKHTKFEGRDDSP